jgi:hypothetical protein
LQLLLPKRSIYLHGHSKRISGVLPPEDDRGRTLEVFGMAFYAGYETLTALEKQVKMFSIPSPKITTIMKQTLSISLFIFFFACTNKEKETLNKTKLILTQDSGFITKEVGLAFLLSNSLTDSSSWEHCNQTDTIGKYYRMENNNHYIMCLVDYSGYCYENHIIIEINENGELLKSERFFHGNYFPWNNVYDGFSKYGDFFGIKTGAGLASSVLYLFKEVTSQDSILPIYFSCGTPNFECFFFYFHTPFMEWKKDELILHYTFEEREVKYDEKRDDFITKIHNRSKFTINYFYENGKWNTTDKDKLKELEDYF